MRQDEVLLHCPLFGFCLGLAGSFTSGTQISLASLPVVCRRCEREVYGELRTFSSQSGLITSLSLSVAINELCFQHQEEAETHYVCGFIVEYPFESMLS